MTPICFDWAQDCARLARIAVGLAEMHAVGIKPLGQADAVVDDECDVMVGADPLQRIGQPGQLMAVDVLHPELECRDRPARQRRLQPVGEIAADILRADQVKLARVGSRRRRED